MTDSRLRELRRLVRRGETPDDLVAELRSVATRAARLRLLPPSFAPYGVWDDDAAEEVFGDWYAARLLGRGHLQALLDRARGATGFRRLAERSLRHHLLSVQDRSQARNLFRRTIELLEDPNRFSLVRPASRVQDRWYAVAGQRAAEWRGRDRDLAAAAWSLGDFTVIRYRAAAAKLSPVLDAGELERFVGGLMQRTGAALTPRLIMDALSARFDLGEVVVTELDEAPPAKAPEDVEVDVALRDTARVILTELSARQREVLRRTADVRVADLAAELGCSVGTVINEQRRIGTVVTRLSEDDGERDRLLNIARDLAYEDVDA